MYRDVDDVYAAVVFVAVVAGEKLTTSVVGA
jgi:hypothetical protein